MEQFLKQFIQQQRSAARRNIEWQFTFEEWIEWWGDDIHKRGKSKHALVMARYGDVGPYHPSNVYKSTNWENAQYAHKGKQKTEETKSSMRKPKTIQHANNISNAVRNTWANDEYKKQRSAMTNLKIVEKFKSMSDEEFELWKKRFDGKTGSSLSNLKRAEKIRAM